ncbi:bacillithiol system redox-active protein YtxJ [Salmonirosea aquatica]|uniref:Bacillithiol system redox-active protein YtxJ n=1 Tax=Salmonirosea aquatica TaxID=2654236 RepID=A0A7C9FZJ5_9BACT|nr:bacillithiol system redox-active protein YtxJ [Cytophagaceae bacterium SJW1-29]
MNWNPLTDEAQLETIRQESYLHPVMIFKHSTRCSISSTALARIQRSWNEAEAGDMVPYYLDLIAYRTLSGRVASEFGVPHQSPQVLLLSKGECVYDASHFEISFAEISQQLESIEAQ